MYAAEPIEATGGPKVYLLAATADPLGVIAAAAALYEGKVRRSLAEVTRAEREKYLGELQKTKIKAPLEFVQFHFLLEGVTRGFTHQLVRQRTATYVQESTRFAVKEDVPVGLPPSLAGTDHYSDPDLMATSNTFGRLSQEEQCRVIWDSSMAGMAETYNELIARGMPAEDARGLLPTNLLTRVHYSTDLRALLDHAGNRLCTQAQFEWRLVFAKIAEAIRCYDPWKTLVDTGSDAYSGEQRWQWEAIADLLRPVCYQIGKCAFEASFDRKCSIRERVQTRAQHGGVEPSQWHKPFIYNDFDPVTGKQDVPVSSPGISAKEWLLDPGAAR